MNVIKVPASLKKDKKEERPMRIYTSYFSMVGRLKPDLVPVSISRSAPSFYTGASYAPLAPSWYILNEYKASGSTEAAKIRYACRYGAEILGKLNAKEVYEDLKKLSGGKDVVLLCWEKSSDFCHRHLVGQWFFHNNFPEIEELKF